MTIKKDEKERIREVSKKIKKCIREKKRNAREDKIQKMLEEVKGTKNISNVKSAKKRIFIPKVKNKKGEVIITRIAIANEFAEFYANLFEDEEGENDRKEREAEARTESKKPIPEFAKEEIQDAIDRLKREKKQETAVENN